MKQPGLRFWSRYSREYLYEPAKLIPTSSFITTLLIILFFFLGIKPTYDSIKERLSLLRERQEIMKSTKGYIERLASLNPEYEKLAGERKDLDDLIPDSESLSGFLEEVSFNAAYESLALNSLIPKYNFDESEKSELTEIRFEMEISGNLGNILPFIEKLETGRRFVGIEDIKITSLEGGSGLANFYMKAYYLR